MRHIHPALVQNVEQKWLLSCSVMMRVTTAGCHGCSHFPENSMKSDVMSFPVMSLGFAMGRSSGKLITAKGLGLNSISLCEAVRVRNSFKIKQ